MSMMRIPSLCVLVGVLLSGCASPQPTQLAGIHDLPPSWIDLSPDDPRVKALDQVTQDELAELQKEMAAERTSRYYSFYGRYTDPTLARIAKFNEDADYSYLVCYAIILRDPTPEMDGIAATHADRVRNQALVNNANRRALADQWEYAWLMDSPGASPFPLVDTGGN